MWFPLSLLALLFWSGSDLFSKLGTRNDDTLSHLKITASVGLVMGLHALYEITVGGVSITLADIWQYMPASALYILSMVLGYVGLRHIELSVSSPICNCSGAFAAILCFIFLAEPIGALQGVGTVLITVGMFIMGVAESREDEEARRARQELSGRSYKKSWLGMLLPISYCILDTLGTFADSAILETLDENVANVAYELTFFACGIVAVIFVLFVKKDRFSIKEDSTKLVGAVCETIGQVFYIQALDANPTAAAPLICSYCMLSCVWAALFLKERLSKRHYVALLFAFAGIIVLGFCE